MIHVAFALHDYLESYSMYTGTAMASLFENTREPVTMHLLHNDTLSPQNRERFLELCASYGQNICFYRISAEEDFDTAAIEKCDYCEGIMFRLYLPQLLPETVDKIIYLDSDLIINMDIRELWDIPLQGFSLAAVKDPLSPFAQGFAAYIRDVLEMDSAQYFNSGVLIMDIARIRKKRELFGECQEFFQKHTTFFPDQDLLNMLFKDDVKHIDNKYNCFFIKNENHPIGPKIYHYNAAVFDFSNQWLMFTDLYFHYWDKTPWRKASLGVNDRMHLLSRMHSALPFLQRKMDRGISFTPEEELHYGQELLRAGEYEKCRDYLEAHLDEAQNKEIITMKLYFISASHEALGRTHEQKDALLLSLRYDIPYAVSCFKLGMLFFQEKQYRQARFWLETSLNAKQNLQQTDALAMSYRTYQKLSKCCIKLNDIDAAMSYNDRAGNIRPDSLSVAINREYFKQLRAGASGDV